MRPRHKAWWVRAVGACLLAVVVQAPLACRRADPAAVAKPDEVVRAYFAAMAAHDCDAVTRLTAGALAAELTEKGCDEAFHVFEEHGVALLRVDKIRRDGRAADTSLVTVVLSQSGKDKRVVVAVKQIANRRYVTRL